MYIAANGARIFVDCIGAGPAIVFIHGLAQNHTLFAAQRGTFSRSNTYVAYDLRGFGNSTCFGEPPDELDVHVEDLRKVLFNLGIDRTTVVGFSIGGVISQLFAVRYPKMVAALVVVDSVAKFDLNAQAILQQYAGIVESQGPAAIADSVLKRWFMPEFQQKNPVRMLTFRNLFIASDPATLAATFRMAASLNLLDDIRAITAPTLILVGEHDDLDPLPKAREIQERIPGAELAIIPGARHTGPVEQPQEFNRILAEFIGRVTLSRC